MSTPRPAHAKNFRGKAKCIPERDTYLLKYQTDWVNDKSLIRVMEKSRRCGISYGTAYDYVSEHALETCQNDTWFSSRDELTAKEFIRYCSTFAKALQIAAETMGDQVIDDDGHTASVQRFANGTRINSVASNPDVFAGKGGNVGLDELALRNDPQKVWDIALPSIDWGGRVSAISTHRGKANFFARLIENERNAPPEKRRGISIHRVTLTRALEEGFLWKLQTKLPESDPRMNWDETDYYNYQRNRMSSKERFGQEYECIPEDEDTIYLPYDLINGSLMVGLENLVEHIETTRDFMGKEGKIRYLLPRGIMPYELDWYLKRLRAGGAVLYAGKDVARKKHLSVDWVVQKVGPLYPTVAVIEYHAVEYSRQEEGLWPILELATRTCIDETGIGGQMTERAMKRFRGRVEGITFSRAIKEDLAVPLRTAFEDRILRIPDDEKVIGDLRMIKKQVVGDHIRFVAEEESGEADSHADRFWALALALHAGRTAVNTGRIVHYAVRGVSGLMAAKRRMKGAFSRV